MKYPEFNDGKMKIYFQISQLWPQLAEEIISKWNLFLVHSDWKYDRWCYAPENFDVIIFDKARKILPISNIKQGKTELQVKLMNNVYNRKKINVHKKNRILRINFKKVKLLDNEKNYCKISTLDVSWELILMYIIGER